MPKLSERDRLAELEERQRKAGEEVEKARLALRSKYAELLRELPVERLAERELREIVTQAIRTGGSAAISAIRALPDLGSDAAPRPRSTAKPSRDKPHAGSAGEEPQPSIGTATDPITGP
ncbi:hypothetical protein [Novosphingobium sp. KACC 22771]|uniref:hypothetical protein n=1 Tax=Novosphingobium sp. KACC 22771 TaxID=3025670 RepID=UPI0023662A28|nr:hypothetical protein [Novosphingobium sp. KACC 22771]WDF75236.1 hypothetical protein PQ467_19670 [Novosphingobium sp. KACC 22771]